LKRECSESHVTAPLRSVSCTSVLVPNRRTAHSLSNHRSKRGLRARVRTALRVGGGGLRGLRRVVLTAFRGTFGAVQAARRVSPRARCTTQEHTHDMQHARHQAHARHAARHQAHAAAQHTLTHCTSTRAASTLHGHAHLCSSNPGARSPLGPPCISNCVGCKRVEPAPSHRATGTPSAGARRWDSICWRHPTPANRPLATWHLATALASQSNCKLYRQSDGASQPVKSSRRQSARQIISTAVSPSNHLDGSQPCKSSRRQSARQIISAPVSHANHRRPASQPRK
jgi:hypothetical protein